MLVILIPLQQGNERDRSNGTRKGSVSGSGSGMG